MSPILYKRKLEEIIPMVNETHTF